MLADGLTFPQIGIFRDWYIFYAPFALMVTKRCCITNVIKHLFFSIVLHF